jgi:hypothetical protein
LIASQAAPVPDPVAVALPTPSAAPAIVSSASHGSSSKALLHASSNSGRALPGAHPRNGKHAYDFGF